MWVNKMLVTKEEAINFESQIAYQIYNSKLNVYPFAHSQIENFLPAHLINSVLDYWPSHEEFTSNKDSGSVANVSGKSISEDSSYNFRHQIALTDKPEIEQIKGDNFEFWKSFTDLLCSRKIIQALVSLYGVSISKRFNLKGFNELFEKMAYAPRIHLIHDKTNYALGPHTDNPGKVVVLLIYFESDLEDSKSSFGTSVYIPKKPGFSCTKGIHHDHDDFIRVFSASFQKNNAFSFCRSDKSFHGVEKVQEKSVERKLLQYSLYGNLK